MAELDSSCALTQWRQYRTSVPRLAHVTHYAMLQRCPLTSLQDGVLLGAVGAYDWNGAVLKETKHGKVVPPKSSYKDEFPEELKNHGAYLGNTEPCTLSDSFLCTVFMFDIDHWSPTYPVRTSGSPDNPYNPRFECGQKMWICFLDLRLILGPLGFLCCQMFEGTAIK